MEEILFDAIKGAIEGVITGSVSLSNLPMLKKYSDQLIALNAKAAATSDELQKADYKKRAQQVLDNLTAFGLEQLSESEAQAAEKFEQALAKAILGVLAPHVAVIYSLLSAVT